MIGKISCDGRSTGNPLVTANNARQPQALVLASAEIEIASSLQSVWEYAIESARSVDRLFDFQAG